ncbi:PREDICTED: coiled-coil domain-containing protein 39 [Papilio xuthus]|uniref:Coiled-coil domain-containing protein 39 n=1 Tax=Papilio xuthus TaxID=66420 RepID=A0AAJ6Z7D1_PAPXU|nr:PREDICTED: coiled-coil domain-containing protein 39 [Papilio xuthus]
MSAPEKVPGYMAQLLEELGWNQGTRIPLADPNNSNLETILIARQNEIQTLKEALTLQLQKRSDLNKYKDFVHTEYQENTRLLFAQKQQLEQEIKVHQLSKNEADRLDKDVVESNKESSAAATRIDRLQCSIARLLKKADTLKSEVCGERGALQEWRAALERNASDITAIEQFTKQDLSKAKALETKRLQLKQEHDRLRDRLNQLVGNLSAEERACERISVQVMEGMEQRKQMMAMWTGAVENLRQRDIDIRHIKEDYAVLEDAANKVTEQCREQQAFCDHQRADNAEATRENITLAQQLSLTRFQHEQTLEENLTLDSELKAMQRELSNMRNFLEKLRLENKSIFEEQHQKDVALKNIIEKIKELKEKLLESTDKSKSSEKRAKQLEEMLNEEERYASQMNLNQQRAMHCSFMENQKLLELKNEEKLFSMQLKASKAVMSKLDTKQRNIERTLQGLKESLYAICYQLETTGARVAHMEGAQAERECSAELAEQENRLKEVCGRHAARVALLERHGARLHDDMRRLARDLETKNAEFVNLQSRLKTSMLNVSGGEKEVCASREEWRRLRVEEALTRLRVAHATRALAGLDRTHYTLDERRLQLDAAMKERLVEIGARRDMFGVQKRALMEECGKLRGEIREREQRVHQLIKRHDIFIASLGKDESGQQLSVTFFKIKFAAERAELRERGAQLDAEIVKRERDVSALEATMRVVHAAHAHFMAHSAPLDQDGPEITELNDLTKQYYERRDTLKQVQTQVARLEEQVADAGAHLTTLADKYKQLTARQSEAENQLESLKEHAQRQENRLQNAHDVITLNLKRAKKLFDDVDEWRIFKLSMYNRNYSVAAHTALQGVQETCAGVREARAHLAVLLCGEEVRRNLPPHNTRLHSYLDRIIASESAATLGTPPAVEESVFSESMTSSRSGVSMASGYTKRLSVFRRTLAPKVGEQSIADDIPDQARRSTVSLRVINLGIREPQLTESADICTRSRAFH